MCLRMRSPFSLKIIPLSRMFFSYLDFRRSCFGSSEFASTYPLYPDSFLSAFKNISFSLILQKCHLILLCLAASSSHSQTSEMNVVISSLLSSAFHSFLNSPQIGFWPYFAAEIALLEVNCLHFVKCNGLFIHPIHIVSTRCSNYSVSAGFCQAAQATSHASLVLTPRSSSYCGNTGLKDSRSMRGLSSKSLCLTLAAWSYVCVTLTSPWVTENNRDRAGLAQT